MLKVFIGEIIKDLPIVELIRPNLNSSGLNRWTERYVQLTKPVVELAENPEESDALLIPHNYNYIKERNSFIQSFIDLSNKTGKKIIVFFPGDSVDDVNIPDSIIFRSSKYRSEIKSNEIILPGYVADLAEGIDVKPKSKGNKAVVGFCGWADFRNSIDFIKFVIKALPQKPIKRQGLWWRKKIINVLENSHSIQTNFIIRKSYSGNEKTIEIDPQQARREYINNILNSDFTLCVKGDGNFSTRFFEVLSLGRVPLLIDTETVLPLENVIDYSEIIFRIDYKDWYKTDDFVSEFYSKIQESDFIKMQIRAREIFEKFLRLDRYFEFVFAGEFLRKYI